MNNVVRGQVHITNNSTDRFTAYQFVRIGDKKFKFVFDVNSQQTQFTGILYFGENGYSKMVDSSFLGKKFDPYDVTTRWSQEKQIEIVKSLFNLFENYLIDFMFVGA